MANLTTIPKGEDILSYQPIITENKKIKTEQEVEIDLNAQSEFSNNSIVMQDFVTYAPNKTYMQLKEQVTILQEYRSVLSVYISKENSNFKEYEIALNTNNTEKIEKIETENFYDINGDMGYEVYKAFDTSISSIQNLSNLYSKINYSTETPTENDLSNEQSLITKLLSYDVNGETEKLNYATIAVDTQLGRLVSDLSNLFFGYAMNLYNEYVMPNNPILLVDTVESEPMTMLFNELSQESKASYENLQLYVNRELTEKLIAQWQQKRKNMVLSHSGAKGLDLAVQVNKTIHRIVENQMNGVFESLKEIQKFTQSISMYLDDLEKNIIEKEVFRRIYKQQV